MGMLLTYLCHVSKGQHLHVLGQGTATENLEVPAKMGAEGIGGWTR